MAYKPKKHKYTVIVEGAKRPSLITSDSEAANTLWETLVEQKEISSNVTLTRDGVPVREFIFIPKPDERERFAILPTEAFRHAGYADRLKKGKPVGARTSDAARSGVGRVEQAQMMEAKKRELFFVGRLSDYFNAVRELYERVCGKSYPDHNYAADDFLLLKLVGDRAELLRTKLDEWVQPCFCRGKAKCLMCETRTLLAGGAEPVRESVDGTAEKLPNA